MLEELLRYINNRFEHDFVIGTFDIQQGTVDIDGALDGQYVWIEGSAMNDGLHQYPLDGLVDERFDGKVWLLAIPQPLVDMADEIEAWCSANAEIIDSPYQSESFGGYSYQKGGAASGSETPSAAWQLQFGARLRPYRKLSRWWV